MGPRLPAVLGALALVGSAGACVGEDSYACSSDSQCVDGGVVGYCEPSGYCSFDDGTCESGRRYGSLAPVELAGMCTAPADEPTGWVDLTTSISTTGPDASSSDDVTTQTSAGPTTTPVDPDTSLASGEATGTTTGLPESETATETAGSSETTGPVVPACTPTLSDDFEGGTIDPAWEDSWESPGCSFEVIDGQVAFTVAASTDWLSAGIHTEPAPIAGGHVRAQVVPFTPPLGVIGVWLSLYDPSGCELQMALEASMVRARIDQTWLDLVMVDSEETVWLQLRTEEDGMVHWEWSTDGMEWSTEHSEESPCDLGESRSAIFAGGEHAEGDPITRAVEYYERCDPA